MQKEVFRKQVLPFLGAIAIFIVFCGAFYFPLFQGKIIVQGDIANYIGMSKEASDYFKNTGTEALWTNSMFGGMPTYQIFAPVTGNLFDKVFPIIGLHLPRPADMIFTALLGFFVLLLSFRVRYWIAVGGAIAYALSTYIISFVVAGHNSKIEALAVIPFAFAGMNYLFNDRLWLGIALTFFGFVLELTANHPQVTYYMFFVVACWLISELYFAIREKTLKKFLRNALLIGAGILLGLAANTSRLWTTAEYSKETIRGPGILSPGVSGDTNKTTGLDRDYAFQYSYGKSETFTLMFPNFSGKANGFSFLNDENSSTLAFLRNVAQTDKSKAQSLTQFTSMYWGDLPITVGPVYVGAIVCFLFLVGALLARGKLRWWLVAATVLAILLSWGSNFPAFNNFVFAHVPMYNKFRAVVLTLVIVCITIPLLGYIVFDRLLMQDTLYSEKEKLNALKWAYGIVLFFCVILLMSGSIFSLTGPIDRELLARYGNDPTITGLINALKTDRSHLIRQDVLRTFIYVTLTGGLLWLQIKKKVDYRIAMAAILLLSIIDLWTIDSTYLNKNNYGERDDYTRQFANNHMNIIKDNSPDYRVLNTSIRLDQDGVTPYYYHSIGGYHGAKLQRIQDVIDGYLSKGDIGAIDMLNTKYVLQRGNNKQYQAVRNPGACGNAWFVDSIHIAENSDSEFLDLKDLDPHHTAVVHAEFRGQIPKTSVQTDSTATVRLTNYTPDKLTYHYHSNTDAPIIFSEIWYRGNEDWKAYIDGKYTPHFRADYLLRGIWAPAGDHDIVFSFEPHSYYTGKKISTASSSVLLILILAGFFMSGFTYFRKTAKPEEKK